MRFALNGRTKVESKARPCQPGRVAVDFGQLQRRRDPVDDLNALAGRYTNRF